MHFQRFETRYQLRFELGEHVFDPLLEWLASERIGYATLAGLGAVSHARVAFLNATNWKYEEHQLDEQLEVVSLIGNASLKDGRPFLHVHATLGRRDLTVVGGHLVDLVVNPNLEVVLQPERTPIDRVLDESCGLYVMQLSERT
jgi:predicted DNA-binding protein with PD1-like motif